MDTLIQELAKALESVMNVIDTVHDNGENCPYCGAEYETHTPRDTEEVECPSDDCPGANASNALIKVRALQKDLAFDRRSKGLTECCGALTTYHDEIECCKVCWQEII
jgi:hypothetical protein